MTTDDFTPTYDLYGDAILRHCVWKCRDREVGQDLSQETFLRFYVCLQREEQIRHARAFLYRIAHNLFINHVRKKKETSLDRLLEAGFEPTVDPWHETYSQLDAERPLRTLRKLRSPYKQVLTRRFIQGLAPREIATVTGEAANTISVRIFRGLKHLRFLLEYAPPDTRENLLLASYDR
ncbi:MAG: RNA polymerase sigma-70 factor, ECF subfamily [Candidatus Peregrinibacteria bacterium Gr01-1014_25]|nr:MAG: RNA polymerase sigma-70 factor, ECF subfamily [Candidatus Peregrinibacteria bacterium Gr01-1014_25]